MKKKKRVLRNIRISLQAYEQLRRVAFRRHQPMTTILEELVLAHKGGFRHISQIEPSPTLRKIIANKHQNGD